MTVQEVPKWLVDRGVGHALIDEQQGTVWRYTTVCGMAGNFPKSTTTRTKPKRICGPCRNLVESGYVSLSALTQDDVLGGPPR